MKNKVNRVTTLLDDTTFARLKKWRAETRDVFPENPQRGDSTALRLLVQDYFRIVDGIVPLDEVEKRTKARRSASSPTTSRPLTKDEIFQGLVSKLLVDHREEAIQPVTDGDTHGLLFGQHQFRNLLRKLGHEDPSHTLLHLSIRGHLLWNAGRYRFGYRHDGHTRFGHAIKCTPTGWPLFWDPNTPDETPLKNAQEGPSE